MINVLIDLPQIPKVLYISKGINLYYDLMVFGVYRSHKTLDITLLGKLINHDDTTFHLQGGINKGFGPKWW